MPKTKIVYFDGKDHIVYVEGQRGVVSISMNDKGATVFFEKEKTLTIRSPYIETTSYYEA